MKTADLQRSKRLKELGWEQEGSFYWCSFDPQGKEDWRGVYFCGQKPFLTYAGMHEFTFYDCGATCSAPTAGEMIEWLLGENLALIITKTTVSVGKEMDRLEMFLIKDGICNALADACAWVKERK